jgi:hypothetical protein
MTDPAQTFKLTSSTGAIIAHGALSSAMECLPDTHARTDAIEAMFRVAADAVAAEERANEARACAIKHFCDGITRLSARIDQFEKQRALSAKRAEAQRKEAAQRQVQRYLDELPDPDEPELYSIDPKERQAALTPGDDGDLEIKKAKEPEQYGLNDDEYPGDLPPELKEGAPAPSGSYADPKPDPLGGPENPHQVQQPISASLW